MKIVPYKGTTVTRLNREIGDELIYERTAVGARVLRDFSPKCTPERSGRSSGGGRCHAAPARANRSTTTSLREADRLLHETWPCRHASAVLPGALYRTPTPITAASGCAGHHDQQGLDEVIADHQEHHRRH